MLKKDTQELVAELRVQLDKVREKTEFLKLKETELRPDDWISQMLYWETQEEFRTEKSLLVGHVNMIIQSLGHRRPVAELRQLLHEIQKQEDFA